MMLRISRCLLLVLALLVLPLSARAELNVVATTGDLAALASAVGGKDVQVTALALPAQDPHFVDARPSLALALSHADLLLQVGAELELGWLPTLQTGARNPKIQKGARGFLDCSELVDLLDRPTTKVDRSQGDIHPSGNPHYLYDPRAAERVAVGIGKRLAELDPPHHDAYLERTRQFVTNLRDARARWEKRLAKLRGKPVIAYHRSLVYLADWLGLSILAEVEPRPGIPPNPAYVAELLARARQSQVKAILQESYYPTSTSALLAQKSGGKLVRLPGATSFPAQGYLGFLDQLGAQLESLP